MIKRILLTLMTLLSIYSLCAAAYRLFEPTNIHEEANVSSYINYNSLREYILSQGDQTTNIFFFYSSLDDNCVYVKNTVMHSVEKETGIDLENIIDIVDITDLEKNMATNRIAAEWGIHTCPAFICASTDGQNITVSKPLEWNPSSPMTATDLEQWLSENGISKVN